MSHVISNIDFSDGRLLIACVHGANRSIFNVGIPNPPEHIFIHIWTEDVNRQIMGIVYM